MRRQAPRSGRSPDFPRKSSGPRFQPVPVKARHDGWTPARQFRFIEILAATRSIAAACRAVGMSRESAYALRGRRGADQFRLAWSLALQPAFVAHGPHSRPQSRTRSQSRPGPRLPSPEQNARLRALLALAGAARTPPESTLAEGRRAGGKVDEAREPHDPPD